MNKNVKKLNKIISKYFNDDVLKNITPYIVEGDQSITYIPKNQDFFVLNHPIAGVIKKVSTSNNNKNSALIRCIIGYAGVAKNIKNDAVLIYNLHSAINSMLVTATKHLGALHLRNITLKTPDGNYVLESENHAGYELRLFIEQEK